MRIFIAILVSFFCFSFIANHSSDEDWGFFGHRRINRLAVFTLPEEMLPLFKGNIDFLTEHAVDPDKRRYAFRLEAPRHFLDMDRYKGMCLSKDFNEAFLSFASIEFVTMHSDTIRVKAIDTSWCNKSTYATMTDGNKNWTIKKNELKRLFSKFVLPVYYDITFKIEPDSILPILYESHPSIKSVYLKDSFTEHGIVPYIIEQQYKRLVKAFKNKDKNEIINISADLGHYIGDAHVPLHACSNYNGQKTDQYGIHAFWESRIPELFADEEYDYLVGKAYYVADVRAFAWKTIEESGHLADSVLSIEAELKNFYPKDEQMCFDQRLGQSVWIQCRDFASAYQQAMNGMVEKRMRQAIHSVGALWYSAWVDAGSPNLDFSQDIKATWIVDSMVIKYDAIKEKGGKGFGRDHE